MKSNRIGKKRRDPIVGHRIGVNSLPSKGVKAESVQVQFTFGGGSVQVQFKFSSMDLENHSVQFNSSSIQFIGVVSSVQFSSNEFYLEGNRFSSVQ